MYESYFGERPPGNSISVLIYSKHRTLNSPTRTCPRIFIFIAVKLISIIFSRVSWISREFMPKIFSFLQTIFPRAARRQNSSRNRNKQGSLLKNMRIIAVLVLSFILFDEEKQRKEISLVAGEAETMKNYSARRTSITQISNITWHYDWKIEFLPMMEEISPNLSTICLPPPFSAINQTI